MTALTLTLSSAAYAQGKPISRPTASAETLYRNSAFAFRYRIPYGWVERTKEMQGDYDVDKGEVFLAIFERPPQAAGDSVNSAVVIADEPIPAGSGLKTAADYLGPLSEMTTSKGFKAEGDPSEVTIDSKRLARADFAKALNEKVTMYQTTLVMLAKGKIVLFTFVADSPAAIGDLLDRLNFSSVRPAHPSRK
jgi:hypothetical protein